MDLVDRKAVLDEITEEYNQRREYHGLKLAWIHLAVNRVGSPWISAEERLPETDDHVLCLTRTKKGTANVVVGYYMDGLWRCGMNSNVTHWMPLPEPPEERIATAPEAPRNDTPLSQPSADSSPRKRGEPSNKEKGGEGNG